MKLNEKIKNHSARIGVVGLGYVGLPLSLEFAKKGFKVTGLDINAAMVENLNRGKNHIKDVNDTEFAEMVETGFFTASTDFSNIADLDTISICVPTPLNKLKDPDVSFIMNVLGELSKYLHQDMLIILESTTYPGTTRELILPELSKGSLEVGKDFFLCFSPERIDPGNKYYNTANTPRVLGGITPACTQLGKLLYEEIVSEIVPVSTPESAEMVKLLENTYRSINIGLVNEVAIMCEKLGIDVWEVIDAAATKPFGFNKFTPGPGLGGHCIPIDPHYLAWKLKTLGYKARFIELAGEINTNMPVHVVGLTADGLNKFKKSINGSKILLLGLAYKPDIDDVRESPALDVLELLIKDGAEVDYFDQYVPEIKLTNEIKTGLKTLSPALLKSYDAVIILTDHSNVDYELIKNEAALIVDTRNVYPMNHAEHIIRLGVGRK